MILCIGTTPAVQRVMIFPQVRHGAVNRAALTLDGAAGKSVNVAKVLRTLGAEPLATGFLGGDRGEQIRSILSAQGIRQEFVSVNSRTRECVTVIDQSTGSITELVEESPMVAPEDYEQLKAVIERWAPNARALVFSGTLAPGGPTDFYAWGTEIARRHGVGAVVDAQGKPLLEALGTRPFLVKPNRAELRATLGRELSSEDELLEAMQELVRGGAERVVITSGEEPALAFDGHRAWRIFPPRIQALNPIGSGDAFTAGLVCRLLEGRDLGDSCVWAAAAGAANALTPMAGEVRPQDVHHLAAEARLEQI